MEVEVKFTRYRFVDVNASRRIRHRSASEEMGAVDGMQYTDGVLTFFLLIMQ